MEIHKSLRDLISKARQLSPALITRLVLGVLLLWILVHLIASFGAFQETREVIAQSKKSPKPEQFATVYTWYGLIASFGILSLLFGTVPVWLKRSHSERPVTRPSLGPVYWGVLVVITALSLFQRVPRLDLSLYGDEIYSTSHFIHGEYRPDKEGVLKFRPVKWTDTVWGYRRPNNHTFFSVVSRLVHEAGKSLLGESPESYNVTLLRLPSLITSILSILVIFTGLWLLGLRVAAVLAGLLLTFHPWHITYSVEVRGYAFIFLFSALVCLTAFRAIQTGRWRWWISFAAAEFALLFTYPAALYILAPLSLFILIMIVRGKSDGPAKDQVARFFAVNLCMSAAIIPLMLPCLPQLKIYLEHFAPKGGPDQEWILNCSGYFLSGETWFDWDATSPVCQSFTDHFSEHPVLTTLFVSATALLSAAGLVYAFRKSRFLAAALISFIAAAVISVIYASATDAYLFIWYVIYSLPALLICLALGLQFLTSARAKRLQQLGFAMLGAYTLLFLVFTHQQRTIVKTHSKEPVKETVALMDQLAAQSPEETILSSSHANLPYYNKDLSVVTSREELEALMTSARQNNKELLLAYNYLSLIQSAKPDLFRLFTDPNEFEIVKHLYGLEYAHRDCVIYRMIPE